MTEEEPGDLLLERFLFTNRAMSEAHDLHIPASDVERLWGLRREVADGRVTLAGAPADLLRTFPNADPRFKGEMRQTVNQLTARDRDTARRILRSVTHLATT